MSALLAKVHIAKKELGLDDPTYRAVLVRVTGHASAKDCSEAQLGQLLDEFKAKGWAPKVFVSRGNKQPLRQQADHPAAKKARAMWISLHQLGVVRDPSEAALEAFGKRQLGVDRLQWSDQAQSFKLIEALKAMAERAGWSQDLTGVKPRLHVTMLKRRLLTAMQTKLGETPRGCADTALDTALVQTARQLRERAG